jgi:hypothetical protein
MARACLGSAGDSRADGLLRSEPGAPRTSDLPPQMTRESLSARANIPRVRQRSFGNDRVDLHPTLFWELVAHRLNQRT